ncbi:MAG: 50S ribosomal protein L23 [Erysipelotrichaceae bacterium]|jgi:large subunit ribosomal protein L23|nr:50S ribosomal protein L23 [Erysipelotrichaceae bacterium]
MSKAESVIIRPIITEKTTRITAATKAVTFEVARTANKVEIRQAVEELFKVKVAKVNVVNVHSKPKRMGKYEGMTRAIRKAVVTLKEGYEIDVFAER